MPVSYTHLDVYKRQEQGIALTHVADRAGIGRSHMWRLLNGEASATLDAVDKLAAALNVAAVELLDDVPKRTGRQRT